jgi:signal transduction histidine kinase
MLTAGERITRIVKTLRNFARLDESDVQEADLHEGLDSTLTLLQHELRDRISVIREYGEISLIRCYPNELNQVFMNLLVNAVQAIEGEGTIGIETFVDGEQVGVSISDTGAGIPEDDVDRIFDPGFTTKGVGVGTGLGLSISYNIVQKHKGEIQVKSEEGKGSTFTVRIPRALEKS